MHLRHHVEGVIYQFTVESKSGSTTPGTQVGYFDDPISHTGWHSILKTDGSGTISGLQDITQGQIALGLFVRTPKIGTDQFTFHIEVNAYAPDGHTQLTHPLSIYLNKDAKDDMAKGEVKNIGSYSGLPIVHDQSDEPDDVPTVTITAPEQYDAPDDMPSVATTTHDQHDASTHNVAATSNPYLDMVQAHAQPAQQHHDTSAASPAPVASNTQGASVSDSASHYLNMVGVDAKDVKIEHNKHGDDHLHTHKHFAHNPLADDFQDPKHAQQHGHDAFANPLEDKHDHKGHKHNHDVKHHDLADTGSHDGNHNAHDQMDNHLVDPITHHHNS
ncbi:hypothetical protein VHA01S_047_00020 [Vibrio halioticoli NBRC 102217]|uniref:Uncharacterized protein n=1 Tax=Vibrio halioticoli NBRC 102217 TaxID=1219072 RepID=V5FFL0_9VIBR|nr:hypothetical protein [Vibrio halioticoli]GAD90533.1 hypothetical protein VHA01S_047_00020 [Vibrio halioticoli NBRC 102217]